MSYPGLQVGKGAAPTTRDWWAPFASIWKWFFGGRAAPTRLEAQDRLYNLALSLPMIAFLLIFFIAPLAFVFLFAFGTYGGTYAWTGEFNLSNFDSIWNSATLTLFARTAFVAGMVTLLTLVLSYPAAYWITEQPRQRRELLIMLLMIPFWTSFLLRTYSLKIIFDNQGLANSFLSWMTGSSQQVFDIGTIWAVIWAEVYTFMPYMALPLYATLERMSRSSIEASYVLGAGRIRTFLRVILPLSSSGIAAGSILVFIIAMGELVIPFLLGGNEAGFLLGNAIWENQQLPGRASALSLLFMAIVFAVSVVYMRIAGRGGLRL